MGLGSNDVNAEQRKSGHDCILVLSSSTNKFERIQRKFFQLSVIIVSFLLTSVTSVMLMNYAT